MTWTVTVGSAAVRCCCCGWSHRRIKNPKYRIALRRRSVERSKVQSGLNEKIVHSSLGHWRKINILFAPRLGNISLMDQIEFLVRIWQEILAHLWIAKHNARLPRFDTTADSTINLSTLLHFLQGTSEYSNVIIYLRHRQAVACTAVWTAAAWHCRAYTSALGFSRTGILQLLGNHGLKHSVQDKI